MKRRIVRTLTIVFAFAAVTFLLTALAPQVHAQQGCADFRAISQMVIPPDNPLGPDDVWGGGVWGTLGGTFITGWVGGYDGDSASHGVANKEKYGLYKFLFGTDSFTMQVTNARFNFPPAKAGFGQYRGHATIISGTGIFQYASGSIDWEAPFIGWDTGARANMTITGKICGILQ